MTRLNTSDPAHHPGQRLNTSDDSVHGGSCCSSPSACSIPAFPRNYYDVDSCGVERVRDQDPGMTLRDWFAGQALALTPDYEGWEPHDYAQHAYDVADAMLNVRESN